MWNLHVAIVVFTIFNFSNASLDPFNIITAGIGKWYETLLENWNITRDADFGLDIYQLSKKHGYPIETHWVKTEDDYILRMHRIPHGKDESSGNRNKPAVLLMHGLSGSSIHWVGMGPGRALAFEMADQGFDVWMGNNRGNTWSRQHVKFDPNEDPEFWDFSFEKCGQYDLPAQIDYMIGHTLQRKVFYVGHSQGTTEFLAMAALRPEYNEKTALFSALAPVVYVKNMTSPFITTMEKLQEVFELVLSELNIYEVLNNNPLMSTLTGTMCANGSPFQSVCPLFISLMCGTDTDESDGNKLAVFMSTAPDGVSKNTMLHFGQNVKSGEFRRFDYGPVENFERYLSLEPPKMDLSRVTAPVSLYYGKNDLTVPVEGVQQLADELPNVVKQRLVDYEFFNHMDFILAKDVYTIVYKELIDHLKEVVANGGHK